MRANLSGRIDAYEYQPDSKNFDPCEKIRKSGDGVMPVSRATSSVKGQHRDRPKKQKAVNGFHRRRNKKIR